MLLSSRHGCCRERCTLLYIDIVRWKTVLGICLPNILPKDTSSLSMEIGNQFVQTIVASFPIAAVVINRRMPYAILCTSNELE